VFNWKGNSQVQSYYHTLHFMLVIQFLKFWGQKLKPLCEWDAIQNAYKQIQCSRSWGGDGGKRKSLMKLVYKIWCWKNWRNLWYWRKLKNSFVLYGIKHEHREHSITCSSCLWNQQWVKYNQRIRQQNAQINFCINLLLFNHSNMFRPPSRSHHQGVQNPWELQSHCGDLKHATKSSIKLH